MFTIMTVSTIGGTPRVCRHAVRCITARCSFLPASTIQSSSYTVYFSASGWPEVVLPACSRTSPGLLCGAGLKSSPAYADQIARTLRLKTGTTPHATDCRRLPLAASDVGCDWRHSGQSQERVPQIHLRPA